MQRHIVEFGCSILLIGLLLAAVVAEQPKLQEPSYPTPQAVFDAAWAAQKNDDLPTFVACFAVPTQKKMAGVQVYGVLMSLAQDDDANDEASRKQSRQFREALVKYGLGADAVEKYRDRLLTDGPMLIDELASRISHPADCYLGILRLYRDNGTRPLALWDQAKLVDVTARDKAATGTFVAKDGDEVQRQAISFKNTGGNWRLENWFYRTPKP